LRTSVSGWWFVVLVSCYWSQFEIVTGINEPKPPTNNQKPHYLQISPHFGIFEESVT
jgi:hypothetical protein